MPSLEKICVITLLTLTLTLLLSACADNNPGNDSYTPDATPAPNATAVPRFEAARCPFKLPAGQRQGQTVKCGYAVVPETHTNPDGKTIKLAVAIFKSTKPNPSPEPIFYLEGGPGGRVQSIIDLMQGDFYQAFASHNDAIFFDQRGVGQSQPALTCPEIVDQSIADAPKTLTAQQAANDNLNATLECHNRLIKQGVNLNAYTTIENAQDINDIRSVLGYQKLNLYGGSYGTLLAQTAMRLFPQYLRSVVLDSVVPPDINPDIESIVTASRSFNMVFDACAKDAACNKAYPDLPNVFAKTFDQLNAKPPSVKITDNVSGKSFDANADGVSVVGALFVLLYATEDLGLIPQLLYQIYRADYSRLGTLLSIPFEEQEQDELGMYYSVTCGEEWAYSQPIDGETAAKNSLPELAKDNDVGVAANFSLCQKWGVSKAEPAQHTLIQSDVPTLVMEGQFDPVTPPAYGQRVAAKLSHSFYIEFPASGHGEVLPSSPCGLSIMTSFFANPQAKPDSSCTASLNLKFRI